MRRWDRLLDMYMEDYRARGVSDASVSYTKSWLERWGSISELGVTPVPPKRKNSWLDTRCGSQPYYWASRTEIASQLAKAQLSESTSACSRTVCVAFSCLSGG